MKLLKPDAKCRYLTDVTPATVKALGCKAVLIDADNTSSYDLTTDPLPGTEDWVRSMKEAGLKVLLLSNAKAERAKVLADHYGIPVIGMAAKPAPFGYFRAVLTLRTSPKKMLMLGDQLFTDVWGANISGVTMLYVEPMELEPKSKRFIRFKRVLEKPFLPKKFVELAKE